MSEQIINDTVQFINSFKVIFINGQIVRQKVNQSIWEKKLILALVNFCLKLNIN